MNTAAKNELNYQKVTVDNAVCNRRFHIAFETGGQNLQRVEITCPHCGVIVYSAQNHPPAILTREENLIRAPDGSNQTLYTCEFLKK